ncbi:SRPBCC family protein [Devosia sp. 2618]|uniref:SRPBCC family protein n=1 Tax=Devosia sp. 2618 TaxID=3156454 RepID=UPI00339A1DB7
MTLDAERDLEITRVIKAPRSAIWAAWTTPEQFAKWWIPAPMTCKIVELDVRPGGAMVTEMSEDGTTFGPHMDACYLVVEPERRIVFTNNLVGGWRPADNPFLAMSAEITLEDHPDGTLYRAVAKHGSAEARDKHAELGFYDGWGAVTEQLAALVER